MHSLELFAGAGGLALGVSKAGFKNRAVVEWNQTACDTIRLNQERRMKPVESWHLIQADVRNVKFDDLDDVDFVAGGPPCQPFSIGGKHRGHEDHRNLFPEIVRAIRDIRPKAFLIENVKGLLRPAFAKFFEHVLLQVTYPDLRPGTNEDWTRHLARLEKHHTKGNQEGLSYRVVFQVLNAAQFGVPQRRERVFVVGFRNDISQEWSFPHPTHSLDCLLRDQWVTADYWERHKIAKRCRPRPPIRLASRIERLRYDYGLYDVPLPAWRTVRDAISDLPDPTRAPHNGVLNHRHNPGARAYAGHTGSPLDEPAKTLKAGDHGVPGGENMLAHANGQVRYFTVRESARLQTFPDNFVFSGSWTEAMRQLGNAVPTDVSYLIASSIRRTLKPTRRTKR